MMCHDGSSRSPRYSVSLPPPLPSPFSSYRRPTELLTCVWNSSAPIETTFTPISIFIGTFTSNGVGGAAALSTASEITVTATFSDATTSVTTFNFDPPDTILGLDIDAEAMQNFQFPGDWVDVVSLVFVPQSDNNVDTGLGLALDNLEISG